MKVWVVHLNNINGRITTEIYSTEEKAIAAFEEYAKKYHNQKGFMQLNDRSIWFGTINNESSFVTVYDREVH